MVTLINLEQNFVIKYLNSYLDILLKLVILYLMCKYCVKILHNLMTGRDGYRVGCIIILLKFFKFCL